MTHNAPLGYSFRPYQLTERRTLRAKPSVRASCLMVRIRLSPGEAVQP
jgi:hypothetical protein